MDFVANRDPQIQEMLESLGIKGIDDLYEGIPHSLKLPPPGEDDGLSEYEGLRLMEEIGAKNTFPSFENYLGAGAYEHHVPALVNAICSKSEFLTSYTPYQAEVSQGLLQCIFEFQTVMARLTGLDIANASLYDGASACAEGVLMTLRLHPQRKRILIAGNLHPHYAAVVKFYLQPYAIEVDEIPLDREGRLDLTALDSLWDDSVAGILLGYPQFFGGIEPIKEIVAAAKEWGALVVLAANPLIYGLYASAGELDVDIAVGDCQPFGIPLQYGGAYAGYLACKCQYMRQMPGRLVGETKDRQGRRGYVLTLQAREQHIRREKATSNICTNQALAALASLVALLWYGKEGIPRLAKTCYQRAEYLKKGLQKLPGVEMLDSGPGFHEFAVKFPLASEEVLQTFRKELIEPGIGIGRYFEQFREYLLVAVTETKSRQQLDRYLEVASSCIQRGA